MSPGVLGETWAKLHIPCVREDDAGNYECRGVAAGQKVVAATKVEVLRNKQKLLCLGADRQDSGPTITGWFSTIMVQSGESARLLCNLQVSIRSLLIVFN